MNVTAVQARTCACGGLLAVLGLVACAPGETGGDSAGAEVARIDTLTGLSYTVQPLADTVRGLAVDSAIVPATVLAEAVAAAKPPVAPPTTPAGTAPAAAPPPAVAASDASRAAPGKIESASPAELTELAARMIIPVKGVPAAALRDSYSELRGAGTRTHEALDILAPRGTPVLAAAAGRVLKLHKSVAGGLMIYTADSSDRFILMYAHLEQYAPGLAEGAPLRQGQEIGTVGSTGNVPPGAPHLHFAIARGNPSQQWWRGEPANPYPLLAR